MTINLVLIVISPFLMFFAGRLFGGFIGRLEYIILTLGFNCISFLLAANQFFLYASSPELMVENIDLGT